MPANTGTYLPPSTSTSKVKGGKNTYNKGGKRKGKKGKGGRKGSKK